MKSFCYVLMLVGLWLFLPIACKRTPDPAEAVEPVDLTKMRYKHALYGSEAECRRRNPNYEINCSEWVEFYPDGKADLLLGGGDIIVRSSYRRTGATIVVGAGPGLPKEITFTAVSDTELTRTGDGSRWVRY